MVTETETETTILDVVEFVPGTAALRPTSKPTLDAIAATLCGNPSIELIEVQSHTRGIRDHAANLALSEHRAAVLVAYSYRHLHFSVCSDSVFSCSVKWTPLEYEVTLPALRST